MATGAIRGRKPVKRGGDWRGRLARTLRRIGAFIVLLLLAAGLALWWAARWIPDRTLYPTQGVTIDAGNGDVRWGSIKAAGADFAYIMGTDGSAAIGHPCGNMAGARATAIRRRSRQAHP